MSEVKKRSVTIGGHKTSLSLEELFWATLKGIAKERRLHLTVLLQEIDAARGENNLSSAIRIFVLKYHMDRADRGQRP